MQLWSSSFGHLNIFFVKLTKIMFGSFLVILDHFWSLHCDHFLSFWWFLAIVIIFGTFDHFWWFWPFLVNLIISGNFDYFWSFLSFLSFLAFVIIIGLCIVIIFVDCESFLGIMNYDHFWSFWSFLVILIIFANFDYFWSCILII